MNISPDSLLAGCLVLMGCDFLDLNSGQTHMRYDLLIFLTHWITFYVVHVKLAFHGIHGGGILSKKIHRRNRNMAIFIPSMCGIFTDP